ncbi:MAG: hypothetical protein JJD97_05925 [Gemmatimonadaceae bacterium]|nr:hypothetical protein [Gemmatimonadaceae bacterium]
MLAVLGGARWKRDTAREIRKLATRAPAAPQPAHYDRAEIDSLPAPVVRYFEFALTQGQPLIEHARIEWKGQFSIRPRRWTPFSATQHYQMRPPGFVWDARIRMTPGVPVLVRDTYIDHEGSLRAAIGGVVKVADHRGTPGIAVGELLRYLGEAVWYPTALLPSAGLAWSAIDDSSATATLSDGATTVSIDAHFGASAEIRSLSAMRPRDVKGESVLTPWVAHVGGYAVRSGMRVPTFGEAAWTLPTGPLPYWRGTLVDVHYSFAH